MTKAKKAVIQPQGSNAGRKRDLAKPHSVRMDDRTRDLIDAAAEISGQTRTEFMLSSARQQAMAVLLDQRLFRLNDTDWASFQRALDEPAAPNEELKALMARKPAWEQ